MTQFILKITLGNEAMQAPYDIANSLENTIRTLRLYPDEIDQGHVIKDINGNTVGSWSVK